MVRESQQSPPPEKILLRGARQLITLQGPEGPRRGAALNELVNGVAVPYTARDAE